MRVAELRVVLLAAAVGLSLSSKRAIADAVPPPPEHCPPGYVAVTSHHGPECLLKTSTKCKSGYCAERGGSRYPQRTVRDQAAEAAAYGAGPPAAAPPAVAPAPAIESARAIESAKPIASISSSKGDKASGGRHKGCAVSSTPDVAAWLIVPLLAVVALKRRRAASRRRA